MNRVLRFVLAALLACSALVLSACQNSPSGSNDKKTYKIGVLRIDDSLPLYTAESEKLFAKHGVDVQVIEFSSAADQQKAMEAVPLDHEALHGHRRSAYTSANANRTANMIVNTRLLQPPKSTQRAGCGTRSQAKPRNDVTRGVHTTIHCGRTV